MTLQEELELTVLLGQICFCGIMMMILGSVALVIYWTFKFKTVYDYDDTHDPADCNFKYTEIRDGKCPNAEVIHGRIYCRSAKCSENKFLKDEHKN